VDDDGRTRVTTFPIHTIIPITPGGAVPPSRPPTRSTAAGCALVRRILPENGSYRTVPPSTPSSRHSSFLSVYEPGGNASEVANAWAPVSFALPSRADFKPIFVVPEDYSQTTCTVNGVLNTSLVLFSIPPDAAGGGVERLPFPARRADFVTISTRPQMRG